MFESSNIDCIKIFPNYLKMEFPHIHTSELQLILGAGSTTYKELHTYLSQLKRTQHIKYLLLLERRSFVAASHQTTF